MKNTVLILILVISLLAIPSRSQDKRPETDPDWSKPYPALKIAGNLYYVGTYDLASYLLVTPKGNILINTGLADSYSTIKGKYRKFRFLFQRHQDPSDHPGAL